MDDATRKRIANRARAVLRLIFGHEAILEAFDWGDLLGKPAMNSLMRDRKDELWQAWLAFSAAGSISAARGLVNQLDPQLRRMFIVLVAMAVFKEVDGDIHHFLEDGAPELHIPGWVRDITG